MFAPTAIRALVRIAVRTLALVGAALVAWSVVARPSVAHGPKVIYRVKAYDTVWSIAAAHTSGDVREEVWQIEQANHLRTTTLTPGEKLVLP